MSSIDLFLFQCLQRSVECICSATSMERKIYKDLVAWKSSSDRKPLILQGARQVGKTYIVNYFAGKEYSNSIYCNFEKDKGLHDFFKNMSPETIIKKLSLYKRKEIFPENTLIIFDEIQAFFPFSNPLF